MKFKKLINAPIFNSSRVLRYAGLHLVESETLTDHTCEISLLCLILYKDIKKSFPSVQLDLGKLLERALVHDLEETITNDIPRPVKYYLPQMKDLMDKVSENYMDIISKQIGVDLSTEWKVCKDKSLEGYIIKVSDMILVARKACREIALKSNLEMVSVLKEVIHYMNDLSDQFEKVIAEIDQEDDFYFVMKMLHNLILEALRTCRNLDYKVAKDLFESIDFVDRIS